jgi:hypothetical protein
VDSTEVVVYDGSGLSRHDLVTPRTIVKVLSAMRKDSAFSVYYDAFPIAGVDGTIRSRMKGTPAENNLRGKTGTIEYQAHWQEAVRAAAPHEVAWRWVRGHDGHPQNEYANDVAEHDATTLTASGVLVASGLDAWQETRRTPKGGVRL